jgi:hypothetical protein
MTIDERENLCFFLASNTKSKERERYVVCALINTCFPKLDREEENEEEETKGRQTERERERERRD